MSKKVLSKDESLTKKKVLLRGESVTKTQLILLTCKDLTNKM
jgi:hypothetical protein